MSLSLYSYKTKAKQDVQEVLNRVRSLLEKLGLASDAIAVQEVEIFCKFSAFLKVIRYRSIADEYQNPKTKEIGRHLLTLFSSVFSHAIVLRYFFNRGIQI